MRICLEKKIIILYLPLYISHILQPLDLSIFGAMKALYQKEARKIVKQSDLDRITKAQFVEIYLKIRPLAMSRSTLKGDGENRVFTHWILHNQ